MVAEQTKHLYVALYGVKFQQWDVTTVVRLLQRYYGRLQREQADVDVTVLLCGADPAEADLTEDLQLQNSVLSRLQGVHAVLCPSEAERDALQRILGDVSVSSFGNEERKETPVSVSASAAGQAVGAHAHVAVGGTFDRLHVGHKLLLSAALLTSRQRLVVGVTGQEMLREKRYAELIEPYSVRRESVERFAREFRPSIGVEVVELRDPFGPTVTDATLEAIVVSDETLKGSAAINERRASAGMPAMAVEQVGLINDAADGAEKVSSTALRKRDFEKAHASQIS